MGRVSRPRMREVSGWCRCVTLRVWHAGVDQDIPRLDNTRLKHPRLNESRLYHTGGRRRLDKDRWWLHLR